MSVSLDRIYVENLCMSLKHLLSQTWAQRAAVVASIPGIPKVSCHQGVHEIKNLDNRTEEHSLKTQNTLF